MPLSRDVVTQRGKTLLVAPAFGYGWQEYDAQRHAKRIATPKEFQFVLEDFWEVEEQIVAILGPVVPSGHPLDGLYLCALPVPYVEIDFGRMPGNYNLLLSPLRGSLTGLQPPPHYDSVIGNGYPEFRGYAASITPTMTL